MSIQRLCCVCGLPIPTRGKNTVKCKSCADKHRREYMKDYMSKFHAKNKMVI